MLEPENRFAVDENRICPACGVRIREHPKCEACTILCGRKHEYSLKPFHGHAVCEQCRRFWQMFERRVGRETTLHEFVKQKLEKVEVG